MSAHADAFPNAIARVLGAAVSVLEHPRTLTALGIAVAVARNPREAARRVTTVVKRRLPWPKM